MSRFAGLALFLAFVGFTLLSVFVEEPWIRTPAIVLALAAMIAALVAMPQARAAAAARIPGAAWLGRTVMALHWRAIGLVFAGCVAVLVLAEVIEDAVEPRGRLADHLAATYTGMRDECLNINMFWSLAQARVVISDWKEDYNHCRRHSALGYQAPALRAAA